MTRYSIAADIAPNDLQHIAGRLRRRVMIQRVLIVLMALVGFPLLVIGPFLTASLLWFVCGNLGVPMLAWEPLFWTCVALVLPLTFWLESRSQGDTAIEALRGSDDLQGAHVVVAEAGAAMLLMVIFSVLGPGLILAAYRRARGQLRHRAVPLDRCAELAGQLLRAGVGVNLHSLQKPGEPFDDLRAVANYLVHYDWVGVGRDGQKVWILSDAKATLGG